MRWLCVSFLFPSPSWLCLVPSTTGYKTHSLMAFPILIPVHGVSVLHPMYFQKSGASSIGRQPRGPSGPWAGPQGLTEHRGAGLPLFMSRSGFSSVPLGSRVWNNAFQDSTFLLSLLFTNSCWGSFLRLESSQASCIITRTCCFCPLIPSPPSAPRWIQPPPLEGAHRISRLPCQLWQVNKEEHSSQIHDAIKA